MNIYEAMNAYSAYPGPQAGKTVLIYRDRQTGRLHEFSLDDTEWQDAGRWEWVDTRTEELDEPKVDPALSEFSLRDAEGDATESLLTRPGRVYMLCVTDSEGLDAPCERRFRRGGASCSRRGSGGLPHARTAPRRDLSFVRRKCGRALL